MKKWLIGGTVLLAALLLSWVWGSPYLTLSRLKHAADARDLATLSAHVDFPRVRQSLHRQLDARLASPADGSGDPLAELGRAVARRLSDPVIDALVTPEGLQAVFASAPAGKAGEPQPVAMRAGEMQIHREAIGRFRLQSGDGQGPQLVFALEGISWRLVEVRLPATGLPF